MIPTHPTANKFGITERGDAGLNQSWHSRAHLFDGLVLITKAPHLIQSLPQNALIHCTITGYGGTILEPGVQPPSVTVPAYHNLVDHYGSERVVLRIDPIIPTCKDIERAQSIYEHARSRVRISFIDAYPHVQQRFKEAGLPPLATGGWLHFPLDIRRQAFEQYFPSAEICSEPDLPCTGCISPRDYKAIGVIPPENAGRKGQRSNCNCLSTKHELLPDRRPCDHHCLYCYWR